MVWGRSAYRAFPASDPDTHPAPTVLVSLFVPILASPLPAPVADKGAPGGSVFPWPPPASRGCTPGASARNTASSWSPPCTF